MWIIGQDKKMTTHGTSNEWVQKQGEVNMMFRNGWIRKCHYM